MNTDMNNNPMDLENNQNTPSTNNNDDVQNVNNGMPEVNHNEQANNTNVNPNPNDNNQGVNNATTQTATPNKPMSLNEQLQKQQQYTDNSLENLSSNILNNIQSQLQPIPNMDEETASVTYDKLSSHARELVTTLDEDSDKSLDFFKGTMSYDSTSAAIEALNSIRTKDTGAVSKSLTELTVALQNMPKDTDGNFLERLFHRVKLSAVEMQARYQKAGASINQISNVLLKKTDQLNANNQDMKSMYDGLIKDFHAMTDYIQAGEYKSRHLLEIEIPKARIEAEKAEKSHDRQLAFSKQQKYQQLINYQQRLNKIVFDWRSEQALTFQEIQNLNIMASANIKLTDTITTAVHIAIPNWYQQASMALFLKNQKEGSDAINAFINATNKMIIDNSNSIRKQTVEIVKNSEAPVIRPETIQKNYDNIIATLQDSNKIIADSEKARQENVVKLKQMNDNFKKQINSLIDPTDTKNMLKTLNKLDE